MVELVIKACLASFLCVSGRELDERSAGLMWSGREFDCSLDDKMYGDGQYRQIADRDACIHPSIQAHGRICQSETPD